jgi:peptide chain release factor subunit 1
MRMPVSSAVQEARRLAQYRNGHPVVSFYLDLDPEVFPTPPARSSQIRSLIDDAHRRIESDEGLDHDERLALRQDLEQIQTFLDSPGAPFKGARALAIFCSSPDGFFETVQLTRPVPGRVVIAPTPYVEPIVAAAVQRRWLVALVNRRVARLLAGFPDTLQEVERVKDDVPGQHDDGGWSQANYERSVEADVDAHLRGVAEGVNRRWRDREFDRLAVGGPPEIVPRFEELLAEDARGSLVPERVDVDLSRATEAEVRAAVQRLAEKDDARVEREALDRLADGIGSGGRAAGGLEQTVRALNERRVATLLLREGFDTTGARCAGCGLLVLGPDPQCPADGGELERLEHFAEAMVESALGQDAEVMFIRHHPDLDPVRGVGALLRF